MNKLIVTKDHGKGLYTLDNGKMYHFQELNGGIKYLHTIDSDHQINVLDCKIDSYFNVKHFVTEVACK